MHHGSASIANRSLLRAVSPCPLPLADPGQGQCRRREGFGVPRLPVTGSAGVGAAALQGARRLCTGRESCGCCKAPRSGRRADALSRRLSQGTASRPEKILKNEKENTPLTAEEKPLNYSELCVPVIPVCYPRDMLVPSVEVPKVGPKGHLPSCLWREADADVTDLPVAEALGSSGGGGTSWTLWGERGWGPHERPACRTQSAAPAFLGAGSLAQTC